MKLTVHRVITIRKDLDVEVDLDENFIESLKNRIIELDLDSDFDVEDELYSNTEVDKILDEKLKEMLGSDVDFEVEASEDYRMDYKELFKSISCCQKHKGCNYCSECGKKLN